MDWAKTVGDILVSPVFMNSIPMILLLIAVLSVLVKLGIIKVKTKHVHIGGDDTADAYLERTIIREQCDFTHTYLMGLIGKVQQVTPDLLYDGYFVKYILEVVYDEIVKWITFNHITNDEAYVTSKQAKVCALVYSMNVRPEFKTPEFQERMKQWVREIIEGLVRTRSVYKHQRELQRRVK